mgnify:CR=1 FL=1
MTVYLDHNATSPMLPEVARAMRPWWGVPANASSVHQAGQRARSAVERARRQVATLLGRPAAGVVFTSGATEANATWWAAQRALGRHTAGLAAIEHPSSRLAAERSGLQLQWLPVGADGVVGLATEPPDALSLMLANHETGVLQPVAEAFALGVPVHVDATQAVGRVHLELTEAEAVVFSGHKLGGPPGIGVLSLASGDAFPALVPGAQERGRRGGTENVAAIVGLGVACEQAAKTLRDHLGAMGQRQQRLEQALAELGGVVVGSSASRVPQTTCVVFPGVPGELVVQALDLRGVAVSSGAACASGSTEPSPVLVAMGHAHPASSVRISAGPHTEEADIDTLIDALRDILPSLAELDAP